MANESILPTVRHIQMVDRLLKDMAITLIERGGVHDASKLKSPELEAFDELQRLNDTEGQAERGTAEYSERTKVLGEALKHHYAHNAHHPEHYETGVWGMDLLDVVEMLCDWRAANLQRDGGAPMSLAYSIEKYGIEPQLEAILRNTAERLGWEVK